MADDPKTEELAETGPLDVDDVDNAKTTALPNVEEKTNPVQRSMLNAMVSDDDETEFMHKAEVAPELEPTEELRAEHLVAEALDELGGSFDARTLETGEDMALERRRPLDDSDVTTLETDEELALRRRRRRPPPVKTVQAVLRDPPPQLDNNDPTTQPQQVIQPPMPTPAPSLEPPNRSKSLAFWRRDSFWRTGNATQPAEVMRVPLTEQEFDRREAHAMKVALAGGFLGAVVALAVAMSTWMAPLKLILLALVLVLPVAVATAWLSRPEDLSQAQPEDFKVVIKPVAAGAAVLLLFTLPWQLGFVRSLLRPFAGNSPAMSLQILEDRSETVAIDECVRIAPNPQRVKALAAGLPGRVEVTRACFTQVTDQPEAAARDVLNEWRPLMVASTVEPERACKIAASAAVLPLQPWELRSAFVDCVVEGSADVQDCCGKALAGLASDELEEPPENFVPDEPAAGSWLTFMFTDLTDRQQKIRKSAGLDDRVAEEAALDFACGAVDQGVNMGPYFVANMQTCGVRKNTSTDLALWQKTCANMRERHAAQGDRTKARAMCDAIRAGGAPLGTEQDSPSEP